MPVDRGMNLKMKHLSSRLTFVYKIVLPTIWTVLIVALTSFMLWDSHNPWALLTLLMLLPMINPIRLNWIMYDDYYVFISNGRTKWVYELNQVKSINEPNGGPFDPFFELEIHDNHGQIRKFDFLSKDQFIYKLTGTYGGNLLEFENRTRAAKSVA
jgi:hypothetical protein